MKLIYPALFHKEDGAVWAEFPDLEGCQTYGENANETLKLAQEALEGYALALLENGESLPAPSDIMDIQTDENSFTSFVQADLSLYLKSSKAIKKTLTIPEWLNTQAVQQGINFSQVLQEALLTKLHFS